ncbi:hypothetical protein D3C80_1669650 [compost metagenome]
MGIRLNLILQRTEPGNSVDRDVTEQLLAGLQIMNIARGNDRLVHLFADFTDFAYNIP